MKCSSLDGTSTVRSDEQFDPVTGRKVEVEILEREDQEVTVIYLADAVIVIIVPIVSIIMYYQLSKKIRGEVTGKV